MEMLGIQFDKTALEPRIGLAWKALGAKQQRSEAATPSSTTPRGARVRRDCGKIRPTTRKATIFNGLCPFQMHSAHPVAALQTAFLPLFTAQPDPAHLHGHHPIAESEFQTGHGAAVQPEHRTSTAWRARVDRWVRGIAARTSWLTALMKTSVLPGACGVVSPDTRWVAERGAPRLPLRTDRSPASPTTTMSAGHATTLCKSRPKQRARVMACTRCWVTPGLAPSTPAFPMGLAPVSPAQPTGRCLERQKSDWSLSQLNLNNQFTASVLYDLPFRKGKHFGSTWNGACQRGAGQLGSQCDRKGDLRIPALCGGQQQSRRA